MSKLLKRPRSKQVALLEKKFFSIVKELDMTKKPLVLGVSSGPDSMCLLMLFVHLRKKIPLNLVVAHVNHGLRKQSDLEESFLKQTCENLNIPYFCTKLAIQTKKNLENTLRENRLAFLLEVAKEHHGVVVLAHHKDDLAETVLKRFFENPRPYQKIGLREKTDLEFNDHKALIFRPLLNFTKNQLIEYLQATDTQYFIDESNEDLHFTRNRLRHQILPTIEKQFGKSITNNLVKMSHQAHLLDTLLASKLQKLLQFKKGIQNGHMYDFSNLEIHPLELQYFFEKELGICHFEKVEQLIKAFFANKKIEIEGVKVDKKSIHFFIEK